jgi:uncharacterized membrane protein YGL010W
VPLIYVSVIGLLASIPSMAIKYIFGSGSPFANWAGVVMVPVFIYYLYLSRTLGLGMILFTIACFYIAHWVGSITSLWIVSLIVFAIAWVFQFAGHKIEGKKPSFLKDLQFLLIGPVLKKNLSFRNSREVFSLPG